nr:DNA glycosylase [Tanacetum cinerariifolium]
REFYTAVLRNQAGWKAKHFKGMTLEEIKENFDPESTKKLKTSEEVPEEVKSPNEVPEEKTHTQNLMHAPVEWKLYDSCGFHHVTARDKEIFMLVEKDCPLRKGLAIVMISYKLQVENYSRMANDLILKIFKITSTPRQQVIEFPLAEEVPTASKESSHCQKKRDATAKRIALVDLKQKTGSKFTDKDTTAISTSYRIEAGFIRGVIDNSNFTLEDVTTAVMKINRLQRSRIGNAIDACIGRMVADLTMEKAGIITVKFLPFSRG